MAAGKCDLDIEQGTTFNLLIPPIKHEHGEIFDLTGYTAQAQIRAKYSDQNKIAEFTCTIDPVAGTIQLSLPAPKTSALPVSPAISAQIVATQYVWDLKITSSDGEVTRLLNGIVNVWPQVTR